MKYTWLINTSDFLDLKCESVTYMIIKIFVLSDSMDKRTH